MSFYVTIAITAYLAFAVNSVIDKFLLKKAIPDAGTYAFYIGILSSAVLVLAPFGLTMLPLPIILIAFASGASFIYGLIALYLSLKHHDSSVVLPIISAVSPLVTFALSFFLVGERLHAKEIWGLVLLVAGALLISNGTKFKKGEKGWFQDACISAVFFALSFTLAKSVYLNGNFITGLIWTRAGLVLGALSILLVPRSREMIFRTTKEIRPGSGLLFFAGQFLAAGAGILQNYAVSLGSVTLTNALQGTQFAFLFVLTGVLSKWFPKILKEDFSRRAVVRKLAAIVVISVGLIMAA